MRRQGHQIILSDGGSTDSTTRFAFPLVDHIISAPAGRALQMNYGADSATGDVLWFLHADTIAPSNAGDIIRDQLNQDNAAWGFFRVRLSGSRFIFRIIELMMAQRSCMSSIATGDQGMFVRRSRFEEIGGFKEIFQKIPVDFDIVGHQNP